MTPLTQFWHEEIDGGWWSGLVVSDEPDEPVVVHVCVSSSPDDLNLEGDFDSEVVHINRGARTFQWPARWPDAGKPALLAALSKHYDWLS